MIKELVLYEASLPDSDLKFSKGVLSILNKKLDLYLLEWSVYVILAFLENEKLKKLVPENWIEKKKV